MARGGFNIYWARIWLMIFALFLTWPMLLFLNRMNNSISLIRTIDANPARTKGLVLAVDTGPNRHNDWTLTVEYKDSYGINHRLYAPIWIGWWSYPSKGDLVEVVYNRDHPPSAYIDGFLDRWGPAFEDLIFVLVLLGLSLSIGYNSIFGTGDRLKSLTGYWDTLRGGS